jgi:diguanylate cyclase (GGDEF)-like protein/putative nucleotidyltransferase with HDIG domain/PAS domain S-box-containing protein
MKRLSTATRLSLSLAALSISVLLAAQSLGLVPDPTREALKGRKELCESVAIQCSVLAERGDIESIQAAARPLMQRNPEILSMGLRQADGTLLAVAGDHERLWSAGASAGTSNSSHVQVPIFRGSQRWGTMEICFKPLGSHGPLSFLGNPVIRLVLFMAGAGFVAYLIYLRKTLQYLDPSSVIPERVKAMLDTIAEGVLVLDQRERIVLANDAMVELTGEPATVLQGKSAAELKWLKPGADQPPDSFPWTSALRDGTTRKGEALNIRSQNGSRALTVNCAPIFGVNGATRGALLTFDDVTLIEATNAQLRETLGMLEKSRDEIERQNKELHALATTDPLTGCRNRRSFYPEFQNQWAAAKRYNQSVACIMVDVDHFKRINDKHGHTTGDQVLQGVAKILKDMARETDVVCRYGGEEFCILLPQADVTAAARAAERYRAAIESERCGAVAVTASLGVSAMHFGARDPQEILDQADKSLYAAKHGGRNRVVRWDEIMNTPEAAGKAQAPEPVHEEKAFKGPIAFHAVTALMSALSHRDKQTAEHSQRVADLCVTAARGMLPLRDCFLLEVAGLLHDIGKLGVPDAILRKPGPLNEDEWKIMRTHERMGVEIISAAFGSAGLSEIVKNHHVWFTGSPIGSDAPTGKGIPLGARLLSIADAYDAIVSNRPYRKGQSQQFAFAELRKGAGVQFDPELVEKFVEAIERRDSSSAAPPLEMSEETAVRIRLDLAKLACAADAKDLALVSHTAQELAAVAASDGLGGIAERVASLKESLDRPAGTEAELGKALAEVLSLTRELQELCRSATYERAPKEVVQESASVTTGS